MMILILMQIVAPFPDSSNLHDRYHLVTMWKWFRLSAFLVDLNYLEILS